ncbi:MAG: hypothetical protein E7599_00960 [Ruminococcaceae bacterium]|nr:hypothetical protein [Oscillospiraceae bacterium]
MKNAIRILSLLLVLVTVVACFAACGGSSEKDNEKKPETKPPVQGPEGSGEGSEQGVWGVGGAEHSLPDGLDFGGKTIKFLVCNGDEATKDLPGRSILPTEDLTFEVNSAAIDRNTAVENNLNVKIAMDTCEQGQTQSKITDILATGLHEYDVVGAYQYYDMGLTIGDNGGFFVNFESETLQDEIYIDVNKPYWDKEIYDLLTYGGCAFWVTGDISQTWVASVFVSFVNGDLWEQYSSVIATCEGTKGITDPFELVDKGLWTMDLWIEISQKIWVDKNGNEEVDLGTNPDVVGFLTYQPGLNNIMADGLAAGAGVVFSTNASGTWEMDVNNRQNNLFAMTLYSMYQPESKACKISIENEKYIMEEFADGRGLMTVNLMHMSEHYLSNMNNFYVLPVPKMIAGTSTSYTTTTHDNLTLFGIPATAIDEGKLGAITATLEMMACESFNLVTPAYYTKALKTRFNHADDTAWEKQAHMIDTIRGAMTHDFASIYGALIGGKTGAGSPTHFFRTDCEKAQFANSIKSKYTVWNTGLKGVLEDIEAAYYMERT